MIQSIKSSNKFWLKTKCQKGKRWDKEKREREREREAVKMVMD